MWSTTLKPTKSQVLQKRKLGVNLNVHNQGPSPSPFPICPQPEAGTGPGAQPGGSTAPRPRPRVAGVGDAPGPPSPSSIGRGSIGSVPEKGRSATAARSKSAHRRGDQDVHTLVVSNRWPCVRAGRFCRISIIIPACMLKSLSKKLCKVSGTIKPRPRSGRRELVTRRRAHEYCNGCACKLGNITTR
jgi:hypothetical protein